MNRRKYMFLMMCAVLSLMLVLAACGKSAADEGNETSGSDTEQQVGPQTTTPEAPQEKTPEELAAEVQNQQTSIVIYDTTGESVELLMAKYGDKLVEKFPKYDIQIIQQENSQTLTNLIAAGTSVDILVETSAKSLQDTNMHGDISDLIKKYNYDMNRLEPSSLEFQRHLIDGNIYGLPSWTRSMVMYYNKDLFDKFGLDYPSDMTWDEAYDLAVRMTREQDGQKYKGLTMAFDFVLMLNQHGAGYVDPQSNTSLFSSDAFQATFDNLARFYRIPGNELPGGRYYLNNQQDPFYKNQTVGMFITLTGAEKIFGDSVNWDIAPLPTLSNQPGVGSQSYPTYFYVTKTSKNRDAAFQIADYITSDEFQEFTVRSGAITILNDSSIMAEFAAGNPLYDGKNIAALIPGKYADPTPKPLAFWDVRSMMFSAMEKATTTVDTNTALREAADEANKKIAELLQR